MDDEAISSVSSHQINEISEINPNADRNQAKIVDFFKPKPTKVPNSKNVEMAKNHLSSHKNIKGATLTLLEDVCNDFENIGVDVIDESQDDCCRVSNIENQEYSVDCLNSASVIVSPLEENGLCKTVHNETDVALPYKNNTHENDPYTLSSENHTSKCGLDTISLTELTPVTDHYNQNINSVINCNQNGNIVTMIYDVDKSCLNLKSTSPVTYAASSSNCNISPFVKPYHPVVKSICNKVSPHSGPANDCQTATSSFVITDSSSSFNITDDIDKNSDVQRLDLSSYEESYFVPADSICIASETVIEDVSNPTVSNDVRTIPKINPPCESKVNSASSRLSAAETEEVSEDFEPNISRISRARRITAKLKKEWAETLSKSGALICLMPGCHQKYVTIANFQTHYKWCTGKKTYQHCPYCESLIITGPQAIVQHMIVEHPEKAEEYKEKYKTVLDATPVSEPESIPMARKKYKMKVLKKRNYSSKENITIETSSDEATSKEFKKCVRFNDIVEKINSIAGEEVKQLTQQNNDIKPIKKKRRFFKRSHIITEVNGFHEDVYDEEVDSPPIQSQMQDDINLDIPENEIKFENEGEGKTRKFSTKSRFVLNNGGYERFNEYLKLTRDWASERKTYSRSKHFDSTLNSSSDTSSLLPASSDSFQLSESQNESEVSLKKEQNAEIESTILSECPSLKNVSERLSQPYAVKSPSVKNNINYRIITPKSERNLTSINNSTTSIDKTEKHRPLISKPIPDEINYGHLIFAKPTKTTTKERVTCYDNADSKVPFAVKNATYDNSRKSFLKPKKLTKKELKALAASMPKVDFDSLIDNGNNEPKHCDEQIKMDEAEVNEQNQLNKNKRQNKSKYSQEDGVKLPVNCKRPRGRPRKYPIVNEPIQLSKKKIKVEIKDEDFKFRGRRSGIRNAINGDLDEINKINNVESPKKENYASIIYNEQINKEKDNLMKNVQQKSRYPEFLRNACDRVQTSPNNSHIIIKNSPHSEVYAMPKINQQVERNVPTLQTLVQNMISICLMSSSIKQKQAALNDGKKEINISEKKVNKQLVTSEIEQVLLYLINETSKNVTGRNICSAESKSSENLETDWTHHNISQDLETPPIKNESYSSPNISTKQSEPKLMRHVDDDLIREKLEEKNNIMEGLLQSISEDIEQFNNHILSKFSLMKKVETEESAATSKETKANSTTNENGKNLINNEFSIKTEVTNRKADEMSKKGDTKEKIQESIILNKTLKQENTMAKRKRGRPPKIKPQDLQHQQSVPSEKFIDLHMSHIANENFLTSASRDLQSISTNQSGSNNLNLKHSIPKDVLATTIKGEIVKISKPSVQLTDTAKSVIPGSVMVAASNGVVTISVLKDSALITPSEESGKNKLERLMEAVASNDSTLNISNNSLATSTEYLNSSESSLNISESDTNNSVRKSSRVRKRKVDPDAIFLHPKRISKSSHLNQSYDDMENLVKISKPKSFPRTNEMVIRTGKRGRPRKIKVNPSEADSLNLTPNLKAAFNSSHSDSSYSRKCSRKGRPRKCVRYVDLNSGLDGQESLDEILSIPNTDATKHINDLKSTTHKESLIDSEKDENVSEIDNATSTNIDNDQVHNHLQKLKTNMSLKLCDKKLKQRLAHKLKVKCLNSRNFKAKRLKNFKPYGTSTPKIIRSKFWKIKQKQHVVEEDEENYSSISKDDEELQEIFSEDKSVKHGSRKTRLAALKARRLMVNVADNEENLQSDVVNKKQKHDPDDDEDFVPDTMNSDNEDVNDSADDAKIDTLNTELLQYKNYVKTPTIVKETADKILIQKWYNELKVKGKVTCHRKECGKAFSTLRGMTYHFETACLNKINAWYCLVCDKKFKPHSYKLLHHIQKVHFPPEQGTPKSKVSPEIRKDKKKSSPVVGGKCSCRTYMSKIQSLYSSCEQTEVEILKPEKSMWKMVDNDELEKFFPPLKSSMPIDVQKQSSSENTPNWFSLSRFETSFGKGNDDHILAFVGEHVNSGAWCPTYFSEGKCTNQYICLSSSQGFVHCQNNSINDSKKGLLQIWNLGDLSGPKLSQPPTLELAIVHSFGKIREIVWCPRGCFEELDEIVNNSTSFLPRLGIIAIACDDSFIRVYSIPHPSSLKCPSENLPFYNVEPSLTLNPKHGGPCLATQVSSCISVSWQRVNESNIILGGYKSGLVSLWNMSSVHENRILNPYLTFPAHSSPVSSVTLAPLPGITWAATGSLNKQLRVWNLNNPSIPVREYKYGVSKFLSWPRLWSGLFTSFEEGLNLKGPGYRDLGPMSFRTITMGDSCECSSSMSEWLNAFAVGTAHGKLHVTFLNRLNNSNHFKPKNEFQSYNIFNTEIIPIQDSNSSIMSSVSAVLSQLIDSACASDDNNIDHEQIPDHNIRLLDDRLDQNNRISNSTIKTTTPLNDNITENSNICENGLVKNTVPLDNNNDDGNSIYKEIVSNIVAQVISSESKDICSKLLRNKHMCGQFCTSSCKDFEVISKQYGLRIVSNNTCNESCIIPQLNEKDTEGRNFISSCINGFHLASADLVQWNPNYGSHNWLLVTNNTGLMHILNVGDIQPNCSIHGQQQ